jgi:hypothetical protein
MTIQDLIERVVVAELIAFLTTLIFVYEVSGWLCLYLAPGLSFMFFALGAGIIGLAGDARKGEK